MKIEGILVCYVINAWLIDYSDRYWQVAVMRFGC